MDWRLWKALKDDPRGTQWTLGETRAPQGTPWGGPKLAFGSGRTDAEPSHFINFKIPLCMFFVAGPPPLWPGDPWPPGALGLMGPTGPPPMAPMGRHGPQGKKERRKSKNIPVSEADVT